MEGYRSSEQIKAAVLASMPEGLGALYFDLWNEVTWLHLKWDEYGKLFGAGQDVIRLLNHTAPAFFSYLERALWEDVLLHLCRLTDPPKSVGHPNLTLRRLTPLIPDEKLRGQLETLVDTAKEKTEFARARRNRRIAHHELASPQGASLQPMPPASRQHVKEALAAIAEVMNCVELAYEKSPVYYEGTMDLPMGANALLVYLEKGLQAQRREDAELSRS